VAEHRQRLLDSKATRLKLEFCLHRLEFSLLYSHSDFSSSIALLILDSQSRIISSNQTPSARPIT
jgi:hypothetical protein